MLGFGITGEGGWGRGLGKGVGKGVGKGGGDGGEGSGWHVFAHSAITFYRRLVPPPFCLNFGLFLGPEDRPDLPDLSLL
jgi:hypothetical protein